MSELLNVFAFTSETLGSVDFHLDDQLQGRRVVNNPPGCEVRMLEQGFNLQPAFRSSDRHMPNADKLSSLLFLQQS
jgi:hypothetical protein